MRGISGVSFVLRATLAALLATAALGAGAGEARAQSESPKRVQSGNGDGMDLHLFRPAIDSKGFFSVNGADILGKNDISLGLVLDYGHVLMPLNKGHSASELVEHAFQGTFQFDYGIGNILVIGLSAPVVLSSGDEATDIGPGGPGGGNYDDDTLDGQALGHVALHAKLRILRPDGDSPIGLALVAQGGVEVAGSDDFGAEPGFFYWPQVVVEKRIGSTGALRLGLNAGFRGHTGSNPKFLLGQDGLPQLESGNLEYGNLVTGGFAVSYRVASPVDLLAETYLTQLVGGGSATEQRLSAEAIGGIKLFVERNSFLMLGGGIGYTKGFQAADQRAVLGFIFEPSIGDRDGDGIKDDEDDCPDDPEDFDGYHPEARDRCYDENGCPDPDNDKDGIPDVKDQCPNDPEDRDGFEDENGCPDPDNDKDGILDVVDKCPNDPETFNGFEDEDGCPDKGKIIIQDNNILILEKINFKTASAEILPESFGIVDAVAQTLVHHPEFTLIEVQGHADERAADKYNLKLTQDRANAVVEALVKKGVDRSKVRAMGYGEYCPLDPESNAAAWEKNRRVEFKVVKTADGPTGVELGCQKARDKGVSPPAN